jgi:hypothetical protein
MQGVAFLIGLPCLVVAPLILSRQSLTAVAAVRQRLDIGEVLEPTRRTFIPEKGLTADERDLVAPTRANRMSSPDLIPGHAGDTAHDMNLDGWHTHLKHPSGVDEIGRGQTRSREPGRRNSRQNAAAIFSVGRMSTSMSPV